MWWNKTNDYAKLAREIADLHLENQKLAGRIEKIELGNANLRGIVNRKLSGVSSEATSEEGEELGDEENKSINNPVLLPENGAYRKSRK